MEFRFCQRIADSLEHKWIPDIYYTITPGVNEPSYQISKDMLAACEPFVGSVVGDMTQRALQQRVDEIQREYECRREILVWSNLEGKPLVIDCVKVVQSSPYGYALRPYMDRSAIMAEVLEKLEKENG